MSIILTVTIDFEGFVFCYSNIQNKEKTLSFPCIQQLVRVAWP